jgi:hypothetical protein
MLRGDALRFNLSSSFGIVPIRSETLVANVNLEVFVMNTRGTAFVVGIAFLGWALLYRLYCHGVVRTIISAGAEKYHRREWQKRDLSYGQYPQQ